jgi:hypothetical protein
MNGNFSTGSLLAKFLYRSPKLQHERSNFGRLVYVGNTSLDVVNDTPDETIE